MPINKQSLLKFTTAIITYPSDFNGQITTTKISDKYKSICSPTTKLVIGREDPDESIQRTHFHLYWDDKKQKNITQNYFDIPLDHPILSVYNERLEKYYDLQELESQLGWDNGEEMVAKLDEFVQKEGYDKYKILKKAHPNIEIRKHYAGSKYEMLRYVCKQSLLSGRPNKLEREKIDEEMGYLIETREELEEKLKVLMEEDVMFQMNIQTIDELIELIGQLKASLVRKKKNSEKGKNKRGRKPKNQMDETTRKFLEKIRLLVIEKHATKSEILTMIKKNTDFWVVYATNYLNYNKLINDMFRGKPPSKPKRNYDNKFYLPKKLHQYITWLDDWVRRWMTGEEMEQRPKGLVLVGPSRTGKTSLMSLIGDFSYFKNIWSVDNWESLTSFTIMDDMDAGDEGKGLSFCWFKPFFGAQDAVTVTDKFKPKQDIVNGKPLIWINNYDYKETFQSKTAQDYIERNMEIVYIHQPLFERPEPYEWIEGHSDFIEWDPKSTWYYQNVVVLEGKSKQQNMNKDRENLVWVDETEKVFELFEEKKNNEKEGDDRDNDDSLEVETGRPIKRNRRKN